MIILQLLCPTCLLWIRTWGKKSLWYVIPQLWWDQLFQFWLTSFVSLSCSVAVGFFVLFCFVLLPPSILPFPLLPLSPPPPIFWQFGKGSIWLLSLHKKFKVNMCLSKIDCMRTYMFLYTEGLNLSILKISTVQSWPESINLAISQKMSQGNLQTEVLKFS